MAAVLLLLLAAAAGARLGDLARRDTGDVFTIIADDACGAKQCAEHGAGVDASNSTEPCACACPQRAPLFREDRELCVDDLPECALATFGTGAGIQRIPFVFLPLKGQIIHPSKEINFLGVKTPICAISGAQFLTRKGFVDLRNTLDADVPFTLFRDEGRTFLQWSGEDEVRTRMSGRVMVVRLLCRDVAANPTSPLDLRGVFTPCVAFRVQGTPPRQLSNVTEVQFAPNAHTSDVTVNDSKLSLTEYIVIGISSLLLGLIYVASVFLYLHLKKRRKLQAENNIRKFKAVQRKDGTTITEQDIVRISNERVQTLTNPINHENGVVKNNPLLNISRQFHDIKHNFGNDSASNMSDSDDFTDGSTRHEDMMFSQQTTSVVIHPQHGEFRRSKDHVEQCYRDEQSIERLPDEHVSIVETTDDRDIVRPVGTTRRKLYFNPAYFEPHLMAEPPQAALEFLVKIREVIAIAKHKMAAKRFQPVLNLIPEEETFASNANSVDFIRGLGSQRSGSIVSLKRENARKSNCIGCPGCKSDTDQEVENLINQIIPACTGCISNKGDKQSSIRRWLENIPTSKQVNYNEVLSTENQSGMINSLLSLPDYDKRNKIKKHGSFSSQSISNLTENNHHKKFSTMSVKSEPVSRKYNLPLPHLKNTDYVHSDYSYLNQTITSIDDISLIGFESYGSEIPNNIARNKNKLPDMVNEAIALDHYSKSLNQCSSDDEKLVNENKNTRKFNTRNNPESPNGNDYETDSLERTTNKKDTISKEYHDSPSSHASPSLSNALPLDEELTMRNAIYKTHSSSNSNTPSPHRDIFIEQNHYETIGTKDSVSKTHESLVHNKNDYSLVSEVYVNNNYNFGSTPTSPSGSEGSIGSRKNIKIINEQKPGCLTIELKDPPENYIKIHESDGFEPDTLDRKHTKNKEPIIEDTQFSRKNLLKNIDDNSSLLSERTKTLTMTDSKIKNLAMVTEFQRLKNGFDLKNISELNRTPPKSLENRMNLGEPENILEDAPDWQTEGRILTLEIRHSKRQRQSTPPTITLKKLARPDVLPPLPPADENPIYDQPSYPPKKVEMGVGDMIIYPKNMKDRSLSQYTFTKNINDKSLLNKANHENVMHSSPMSASVEKQPPDCDNNKNSLQGTTAKKVHESIKTLNKRRPGSYPDSVNSNTYVKGTKEGAITKQRFRRKRGSGKEESGYLSSDSASSKRFAKKLVIAKTVSCTESDDTENEARSESGAESVETHSVYFGSFRKLQMNVLNKLI